MSEAQFTKLLNYMQKEFQYIRYKMETLHQNVTDTKTAIAELSSEIRGYRQELVKDEENNER